VSTTECPREEEVLEAVMLGRWPGDLRHHADACPVCRDLATVAAALHEDRDDAWREAHPPTSGQVWWRASTRARAEAALTAARPITVLQAVAGACAAGLAAGLVTLGWPSALEPLAGMAAALARGGQRLGAAAVSPAAVEQATLSVVVLLGAGVILTPFVIYLILSETESDRPR
jgi:hypothetical protein